MKCIILAGGTGDGLWPLSRKNYPKQFLNFGRKLSLFQEAITRNMPLVDGYYFVTNEQYHTVIDSQLQQFQGLKYRVLLEEEGRGTAAALAVVAETLEEEEQILVMPADLLIAGDVYSQVIYAAKQSLQANPELDIMMFGVRPDRPCTDYGYISYSAGKITSYVEKPSQEDAINLIEQDNVLWNSGLFLCTVAGLKAQLEKYVPKTLTAAKEVVKHSRYLKNGEVLLPKAQLEQMPRCSMEKAVFEKSGELGVVEMQVSWSDVSDFGAVEAAIAESKDNVICNNTDNVKVINLTSDRLVVANDVSHQFIVNTPNALYVTSMEHAKDIKSIIDSTREDHGYFFDESTVTYRPWGTREVLQTEDGYRVRKVTIFPGMSLSSHTHEKRCENFSVAKGTVAIELNGKVMHLTQGESVAALPGQMHRLYNDSDEVAVLIEIDTGAEILESDMVHFDEAQECELPNLYRMIPAFKDYLWGGNRLVEQFGKHSPYDITAESWELSAHSAGQSVISGGPLDGKAFGAFVEEHGAAVCGWKSNTFDHFPILIKFIDAKNALSIQIHPDDDYAYINENEFGKNEMWYVMDAAEDSFLYCGLNREVSQEEIERRIADGTITEVLNELRVKTGDVVFVPAGTIHAIGAGILVCEIQQNSNSTYRVYDYKRVDKDGRERELHVDKALDVVNTRPYMPKLSGFAKPEKHGNNTYQILSQCKYFQTAKYTVRDQETIVMDDASFLSLVFLSGTAKVLCGEETMEAKAGDSIFVSAGRKVVHIIGECEVIATNI